MNNTSQIRKCRISHPRAAAAVPGTDHFKELNAYLYSPKDGWYLDLANLINDIDRIHFANMFLTPEEETYLSIKSSQGSNNV